MAKSRLVKIHKRIEAAVTGCYKKLENAVTTGYYKIEDGFVDCFLTHDGETIGQAKKRLKQWA